MANSDTISSEDEYDRLVRTISESKRLRHHFVTAFDRIRGNYGTRAKLHPVLIPFIHKYYPDSAYRRPADGDEKYADNAVKEIRRAIQTGKSQSYLKVVLVCIGYHEEDAAWFFDRINTQYTTPPHVEGASKVISRAKPVGSTSALVYWTEQQLERLLARIVTPAIDFTAAFAQQRKVQIASMAAIGSLILLTFAADQILSKGRVTLPNDSILVNEFHNTLPTLIPMRASSQVDYIESGLNSRRWSQETSAEFISYLALLHFFTGDSEGAALASDSTRIAPTNPDLMLRSLILSTGNLDSIAAAEAVRNIQLAASLAQHAWTEEISNYTWLFSTEGRSPEDWTEETEIATWRFIESIPDQLNRELLFLRVSAATSWDINSWFVQTYFARTRNCEDSFLVALGATIQRTCQFILASHYLNSNRYEDALTLSQVVSDAALQDGSLAQYAAITMFRAEALQRANPTRGDDEAAEVLVGALPVVRSINNETLKFEFLRMLFGVFHDWPKSEIERSLIYAREAFAVAQSDFESPLFRGNNFLQLYASSESTHGNAELALRIYEYLYNLPQDDALFPDQLAHAEATAHYASQLATDGRQSEANEIWLRDGFTPLLRAIEELPELASLDLQTHPRDRAEDYSYRKLENRLRLIGAHGLIYQLYQRRVDNFYNSTPEARQYYNWELLNIRAKQLQSIYEDGEIAIQNGGTTSDVAPFIDNMLETINSEFASYNIPNHYRADIIDIQLRYGKRYLDDSQYLSLVREAWDLMLSRYLSLLEIPREHFLRLAHEVPIRPRRAPVYDVPRDWISIIDYELIGEENRSQFVIAEYELVYFLASYYDIIGNNFSRDELSLSAYALLNRNRSQLNMVEVRDDYLALIYILRSLAVQTDTSTADGMRAFFGYDALALNFAELWLDAYQPTWTISDREHSYVAAIAAMGWYEFNNTTRAISRLDEFEAIHEENRIECPPCVDLRERAHLLEAELLRQGLEP